MKISFIGMVIISMVFAGCTGDKETGEKKPATGDNKGKPPSSFSDTLKINSRSAVFYFPDSLQLEKIKEITEKAVYESIMHEYSYQLRYIRSVLNKAWPDIKIIDAKNVRYLHFVRAEHETETIDLDTKNDAYGLFVFDPGKRPAQLDLPNAESEIGFYFPTNKRLKQSK